MQAYSVLVDFVMTDDDSKRMALEFKERVCSAKSPPTSIEELAQAARKAIMKLSQDEIRSHDIVCFVVMQAIRGKT